MSFIVYLIIMLTERDGYLVMNLTEYNKWRSLFWYIYPFKYCIKALKYFFGKFEKICSNEYVLLGTMYANL